MVNKVHEDEKAQKRRDWYLKNKEKVNERLRQQRKEWSPEREEQVSQQRKEWYRKNKEKIVERRRKNGYYGKKYCQKVLKKLREDDEIRSQEHEDWISIENDV